METFEVPVQAIIDDLVAENRKLVLEASTLRAAIREFTQSNAELLREIENNVVASSPTEE